MPKYHLMRRPLVVLGLAATVALAACGGSGGTNAARGPRVIVSDPVRLVAATADKTAQAKTAKVAVTATIDAPGALMHAPSFDMDGAIALDGSSADFTMNLGSLLPNSSPNARVEARVVGGVMYMDFGSVMRSIAGSSPVSIPGLSDLKWVKIDGGGLIGSDNSATSPASFTQYLDYLDAASAHGVDTTHYRAELDWSKIVAQSHARLDKLSPRMRALAQRGIDMLQGSKTPLTADVWIGADGLTRRLQMRIPFPSSLGTSRSASSASSASTPAPSGSSTESGSMTMRIDLYDFGTPVDVQPPPASEVTDMSSVLGGALGGSLGAGAGGGTATTSGI